MTWYAISIAPSSTHPARVVSLSRGPRNGLRQSFKTDWEKFQIERDLAEAGITAFVPADMKSIRDRQSGGYVLRRFAMLRGYAFVQEPRDWICLSGVRGVTGLLGSGNVPIRITEADIAILRLAQAQSAQIAADMKAAIEATRFKA